MTSGSVAGAEIKTFFAPSVQVLLRAFAVGEEARRLEDDVDAEVPPRQCARIALGEDAYLLPGRLQDAVGELDLARERAERGVVAQEMRHRRSVADVVQRDDVEVGAERMLRTEEVPSDPAEAVDADANRHPLLRCSVPRPAGESNARSPASSSRARSRRCSAALLAGGSARSASSLSDSVG